MTKLKLSKKNIEKTIENFPTLQQKTTFPHSEKPLHPESSSTSPNKYQERHDKPLDNVQTVPLDCKIKENNPELPTTSKEDETQKRKHSPFPQTSIPSVDLKPRKKRANSKEKNKQDMITIRSSTVSSFFS